MTKTSFLFINKLLKPVIAFGAVLAGTLSANVAAEVTNEQKLKAALIYRMGSYVTWKDTPQKITYCFIGGESHNIGKVLSDKVKVGKLPDNITVLNKDANSADTIGDCSIVYITEEFNVTKELVDSISRSVFTITNSSSALKQGFIASIEVRKNKHLISISKRNLKNSDISVNSRFLSYVKLM